MKANDQYFKIDEDIKIYLTGNIHNNFDDIDTNRITYNSSSITFNTRLLNDVALIDRLLDHHYQASGTSNVTVPPRR